MIPVRIRDANVTLGKPDNWDSSHGECDTIYARREPMGATSVLYSAWKPSAAELEALILGGSVVLGVVGAGHPPVMLYVSGQD